LTLKQYLRHLPKDSDKPSLFMNPILNPASAVWYNKSHKVSAARCGDILQSMAKIVGIDTTCFTNKSGRATLVTRMAAQGIPDEIGMMVTGHHTADGYSRYDRTADMKMEAANLVSRTPELSWKDAMAMVSKKFLEEQYVGSMEALRPLVSGGPSKSLTVGLTEKQVCGICSVLLVCVGF
jgi:hypothetical protein